MHKSEPRANPTLINHSNMVYELKVGTNETHKNIGSLKIQLWSLFNIPLYRINCTLITYVNNNKKKFGSVIYYLLHAKSPWTSIHNLAR